MLVEAIASRFVQKAAGALAATLTQLGSLRVAPVECEGDEATRAGMRFDFSFLTGVTGIAPVQAIPTTAAQWLLYNPQSNPVAQYIDELGVALVSGTAGAGNVLYMAKVYGQYLPTPANLPVKSVAGMGVANRGGHNKTSQLVITSAATLQNGPPILFPIAECDSANTAILSVSIRNRDIRGKIIIPPGEGLALYVCGPAGTTPLFAPFGSFRELVTDLE